MKNIKRISEVVRSEKKKVIILGGGPNRIGQGIEFDYCCCHAAQAVKELGLEAVMVNCNPETVSTDYDTSDRLYFEPMTVEDIVNILDAEKPIGVIVQFGGQTPLNLALALQKAGAPIIGTSPESIDRAEDREIFNAFLNQLGLRQPAGGAGRSFEEVCDMANGIGYPVLVRPSYVLGGRAMEVVYDDSQLREYFRNAVIASPERPVLVDKFLEHAIEVDVDAISDGRLCVIGGILEHIEEAGVHSGDAAMVLPPITLSKEVCEGLSSQTNLIASKLGVIGLMNIQFAVKDNKIYILEVNPRASRTVPFVSKAIGVSLAKLATKVMLGKTLEELGFTKHIKPSHIAVKESVFPFSRFPGSDTILGPEMRSTGEVMGLADDFPTAFAKSQMAAGMTLPLKGNAVLSIYGDEKGAELVAVAEKLVYMGFKLYSTEGTHRFLMQHGVSSNPVKKYKEGRPNITDMMINHDVALIINTASGKIAREDEVLMRNRAWLQNIPIITTIQGALAAVKAIEAMKKREITVKTLQEYISSIHPAS